MTKSDQNAKHVKKAFSKIFQTMTKILIEMPFIKMLISYEKGRKPSDYRVIAGFRNEIIMLYEILCPTPEKEEKQDA